jgi:hypothetical protein
MPAAASTRPCLSLAFFYNGKYWSSDWSAGSVGIEALSLHIQEDLSVHQPDKCVGIRLKFLYYRQTNPTTIFAVEEKCVSERA